MTKRTFDFKHPDFKRNNNNHMQKFLKANYDKPITEEQFVEAVASWPKRKLHNSKTRSPSAARYKYRRFVRVYGLFPGGQ